MTEIEGPVDNSTSLPFASALAPGTVLRELVTKFDFVEEEFFVSGTSDVFGPNSTRRLEPGEDGWTALGPLSTVVRRDAPFTTRVQVVRPRDPSNFSGIVHAIPFHVFHSRSALPDLNVFRDGDVWVGIEVCDGPRHGADEVHGGGVAALRESDPKRYGRLSLTGGDPADWGELGPGALGAMASFDWTKSNALANTWTQELYRSYAQGPDIFFDVIEGVRTGRDSVVPGFEVRHVYTYAASAGSLFLRPMIEQGHHDRRRTADGRPPIDGYVIAVGVRPDNRPSDAVLVNFQTESEAMRAIAEGWEIPADTDDPKFRYYELPGAGHVFSAPFGERGGSALALAERLEASDEAPEYELYDKMNRPIMWHIYDGMTRWLDDGVPLPRAPRITRDPSAPDGIARDEHANALGGLRTPWVDLPDATYVARYPGATLNAGMKRFDAKTMRALYGSHAQYERQVRERLEQMITDGWIRPDDIDLMMPVST